MIRRTLLAALVAGAIAGCASNDALDEDQTPRSRYSGEVGESPVGVIPEATLLDAQRNKSVDMTIEYPTRAGSYPLIVFSPGFGMSSRDYIGLSSYWASQGFVVVKVSHADSGRATDASRAAEIWQNQTPADWRNRSLDMTFLLDSLDALEERYPELKGKADRTKIGFAGHSYGAFTAMLAAGVKTFPGGTSYSDPRVKAVIALSPPGPGESRGLTEQSWAEVRLPALFMTGTEDTGTTETETPEWRKRAYELSPAGDKWLVILRNAGHGVFTGRLREVMLEPEYRNPARMNDPRRDPFPEPQDRRSGRENVAVLQGRATLNDVKAISLAFWDAYLRGDAEGRTALEKAGSRGGVELIQK